MLQTCGTECMIHSPELNEVWSDVKTRTLKERWFAERCWVRGGDTHLSGGGGEEWTCWMWGPNLQTRSSHLKGNSTRWIYLFVNLKAFIKTKELQNSDSMCEESHLSPENKFPEILSWCRCSRKLCALVALNWWRLLLRLWTSCFPCHSFCGVTGNNALCVTVVDMFRGSLVWAPSATVLLLSLYLPQPGLKPGTLWTYWQLLPTKHCYLSIDKSCG